MLHPFCPSLFKIGEVYVKLIILYIQVLQAGLEKVCTALCKADVNVAQVDQLRQNVR